MESGLTIVSSKTFKNVKLPYCITVSFDGDGKQLRNELVSRYDQGDFSCQIERYTSMAIINFRNEQDAADFLMRTS
jgi:hypothetical protein